MTTATDAVALLERAVGFTRGALASVTEDTLLRRTPCGDWSLGQLLGHMGDGLDAFTEASSGFVDVEVTHPKGTPLHVLREKACSLLGAWASPAASRVRLGGADLDSSVLLLTGALEIAVHGWDVAQTTGSQQRLPPCLAIDLVPAAQALVAPDDRGVRFAEPVPTGCGEPADVRLLGWLGRRHDWASVMSGGEER